MVAGNNSRNGFWTKWIFWWPLWDRSVAGLAGFWTKYFWKMVPIFLEALSFWARCRRRFFFQKNGPHIFTSPELLGTLPQALFFFRKMAPIFLQALSFWVRCRRRFFFSQKNGHWIFGGPTIINFDVRCSVAWANQNYFPTCSRLGGPSPIILI